MNRHLSLATLSFALCFAMWGLIAALGPLLRQALSLTSTQAALLVVVPVLLGSVARIPAGMLTDRFGGRAVFTVLMVFVALAAAMIPGLSSYEGLLAGAFFLGLAGASFALLMSSPSILPFTVGALGCAALRGLSNGGVFKLVPQYFPNSTGVVTGLVGAMGGLGGFFPPLLLGFFRDRFGVIWPGFLLLAAVSAGLWKLNARVFLPQREALEAVMPAEHSRRVTHLRAGALLGAAIVIGSRNLQNFDAELVIRDRFRGSRSRSKEATLLPRELKYDQTRRPDRNRRRGSADCHSFGRSNVATHGTLEAHLAGHPEPILPAAIISGILFAACGGLFLFIRRIDVDVQPKDDADRRRNDG